MQIAVINYCFTLHKIILDVTCCKIQLSYSMVASKRIHYVKGQKQLNHNIELLIDTQDFVFIFQPIQRNEKIVFL